MLSTRLTLRKRSRAKGGLEPLGCHDYDLVLSDGLLAHGTGMIIADKASDKRNTNPHHHRLCLQFPRRGAVGASLEIDLSRYDVLQKPLSPTQLISAINDRLGARPAG